MFKKILEVLKKIGKWLVFSSSNADKISLTVKGILYALIPAYVLFMGLYDIQTDSAKLSAVIDQIGGIVIVFGGMITAIMAGYGALRKIFTTATGTNAVINSFAEQKNSL